MLRPNSALRSSMSPSSIVSHRHSVLNESEYPCSSIPSHLEDKIQQRPIQNSRSNSKLKGIQKQTRGGNKTNKNYIKF